MEQTPPRLPFSLSCTPPFLIAAFADDHDVISWSLTKPGFQIAARVAWIEVRNSDLPADSDPVAVLHAKISAAQLGDAVTLITSRDIRRHHVAQLTVDGVTATCLATVGLSNGERIGQRINEPVPVAGTVNVLLHFSMPLTAAALIEATSLVAEAKTAAILESQVRRSGVAITGTGTDCIAVAAPRGENATNFVGKHTAAGEAAGAAAYHAIAEGISTWIGDYGYLLNGFRHGLNGQAKAL